MNDLCYGKKKKINTNILEPVGHKLSSIPESS